jgi:hypothetical protein
MARSVYLSLTDRGALGLFFIQRYRFLTIKQFARVTDLHHSRAADTLRVFQQHGLLGYFGNTRLAGHGKTPKAYFLTRKGYDLLREESDFPPETLGTYTEIKVEAAWSPQMYHRLRTVDLLVSLEVAVRERSHLSLVHTFLEYRRLKRGNQLVRETTDYVDPQESADNKIIPDAAYILENTKTQRRALFFLEMDMATERITTSLIGKKQTVLHQKFCQYDRYLQSFRYTQTYAEYGDFRFFTLVFPTFKGYGFA